jgi:hypothetical protein
MSTNRTILTPASGRLWQALTPGLQAGDALRAELWGRDDWVHVSTAAELEDARQADLSYYSNLAREVAREEVAGTSPDEVRGWSGLTVSPLSQRGVLLFGFWAGAFDAAPPVGLPAPSLRIRNRAEGQLTLVWGLRPALHVGEATQLLARLGMPAASQAGPMGAGHMLDSITITLPATADSDHQLEFGGE